MIDYQEQAQASGQKPYQDVMPKVLIEPNSRVHVRINPSAQSARSLPGEYLGVSHYDFIMFKLPSVPGVRNLLLPRTVVEVRYLHEGSVHSFQSEVMSHVIKPSLLLFLEYPGRINIVEMRTHKRTTCSLPVMISSRHGDTHGIIGDISQGGCRITFNVQGKAALRQLCPGEKLVLQMALKPDGEPIVVNAAIKSLEALGNCMGAGALFEEHIPAFTQAVDEYLSLLQEAAE